MKSILSVTDRYGKQLHTIAWTPDGDIKGIVQIVHGIAEHAERYNHFANFLNRNGYAVYAHDHRGHGQTDPGQIGHIDHDDGFNLMVENTGDMYNHISTIHPGLPHVLFGHSMGSFLVQRYMQITTASPAGIVYSGSNGKPPVFLGAGILLADIIHKIYGPDAKSKLINNLVFGPYKKHFKPAKTDFDWLSRDKEMVQLYIDDPLCGFIPSASFFSHMFKGLKTLHAHKPFSDHNKSIPILLISGDSDPVSGMGKGVKQLEKLIKKSGVKNLAVKLYPGGRHEMLNETNRIEVMNDILNWINRIVKPNKTESKS